MIKMNVFNNVVQIEDNVLTSRGGLIAFTNVQNGNFNTYSDLQCKNIYCNAIYTTSDPSEKEDIEELSPQEAHELFSKMKPYKYKLNGDVHYGVMLNECPDEICKNKKVDYNSILAIMIGELKFRSDLNQI